MPLFSIITVCFNAAEVISQTMESLYDQTYDDYEYIIIDGLSKDNTLQVIENTKEKYDKLGITKVISEKDQGIYDAMNKGVRLATGKYCCFMNAGDSFVSSNVLLELSNRIVGKDYGFVYGNVISVGKNFKRFAEAKLMSVVEDTLSMPYCHQALFVLRECLLVHPFNLHFKNAADYEQCIQLYKSGLDYLHVDIIIASYQIGGKSEKGAVDYFKEKCEIRKINCFAKPTNSVMKTALLKLRIRGFVKRILPSSMIERIRKFRS